ncbi:MAG: DNA polymerase III subunit gamma/tau [Anaerolineaceae bacterium]
MAQALYRTWRPHLWEEVVGQDHIVQTLKNAIAQERVGHAYLFGGPRGTGKTTSARLLAKAVNCLDPDLANRPCDKCANCVAVNEGRFMDLIEIDAASNTSVEDIRDLRDKVGFAPSQGRFKVYIIDEVHMLSTSAFNALLKTLEEPPSHVIFILATTEIHKIPATVLSRCQRHEFRRIPVQTIIAKLKTLTKKEKIQIDDEALSLVARQATGSLRDAISLVDQLSSVSKKITLQTAQDALGTATSQAVIDLIDAILNSERASGMEIIHKALDSGSDPRQFARQIVDYLRNLLVIKLEGGKSLELMPEVRAKMTEQAKGFPIPRLVSIIGGFSEAATDLKANWHPGLGLELAYSSAISDEVFTQSDPLPVTTTKPVDPATVFTPSPVRKEPEATKPESKAKIEPEKPAFAPGSALSLDLVTSHWSEVKKHVKLADPMAAALLNSCKLSAVEGNTITLNFSSPLLYEKINNDKTLRTIKKTLIDFFGQPVEILATVGQGVAQSATGYEPGGLVERAEKELGAKVRKVETKKDKE